MNKWDARFIMALCIMNAVAVFRGDALMVLGSGLLAIAWAIATSKH